MSSQSVSMQAPVVDAAYREAIDGTRTALRSLLEEKNCAPIMLRLAFHDAGTYDPATRSGGANGSIRHEKMYGNSSNAGMKIAVDLLEPIKAQFPGVTYADLYQLAGVVAVEVTGGPKIDFVPGRKDSMAVTPDTRLPDAKQGAQHLRDVFHRMGFSDQEVVALSGSHTLGKAHKERSGFEGNWTNNPYVFDNAYYKELLKNEAAGLLKLPSDTALVEDPAFRPFVELYAQDERAFFRDYAAAHKKMSELGCKDTSPAFWGGKAAARSVESDGLYALLGQAAVGVAVTTAVVLIAYFKESRKLLALK